MPNISLPRFPAIENEWYSRSVVYQQDKTIINIQLVIEADSKVIEYWGVGDHSEWMAQPGLLTHSLEW